MIIESNRRTAQPQVRLTISAYLDYVSVSVLFRRMMNIATLGKIYYKELFCTKHPSLDAPRSDDGVS